jgi:hypothetical protein
MKDDSLNHVPNTVYNCLHVYLLSKIHLNCLKLFMRFGLSIGHLRSGCHGITYRSRQWTTRGIHVKCGLYIGHGALITELRITLYISQRTVKYAIPFSQNAPLTMFLKLKIITFMIVVTL